MEGKQVPDLVYKIHWLNEQKLKVCISTNCCLNNMKSSDLPNTFTKLFSFHLNGNYLLKNKIDCPLNEPSSIPFTFFSFLNVVILFSSADDSKFLTFLSTFFQIFSKNIFIGNCYLVIPRAQEKIKFLPPESKRVGSTSIKAQHV